MKKICKNCGKEYEVKSVTQLYCSKKCGNEYRKTHDINEHFKSITFYCKNCGKKVKTKGNVSDRRKVFCSEACERKYYKHIKGKY